MGIFKSADLNDVKAICRNCASFNNNPASIEETFPGLAIMSSGFASVRDQDGVCNRHELYLSSRDSCPQFSSRSKVG